VFVSTQVCYRELETWLLAAKGLKEFSSKYRTHIALKHICVRTDTQTCCATGESSCVNAAQVMSDSMSFKKFAPVKEGL